MGIKRVLVTGSEGYIGSMLCPGLMCAGYEVVRFDKILGNDILNYEEIRKKSRDCDIIIHLAAIVGLKSYEEDNDMSWQINVIGSKNVVDCGKKVVLTSVTGKYEKCNIVTEKTKMIPTHDYFKSKIEAEKMVLDKNGIVLRFGTLYGKSLNMRNNLLIHDICNKENKIDLFQPTAIRPITNIVDAIRAIIFLMNKNGGIYNVVSCNINKMSIAQRVKNIKNIPIEVIKGSDIENRDYVVSTNKIEKLGFKFFPNLDYEMNRIING